MTWAADHTPACAESWYAVDGCERSGGWEHSCARRKGHDRRCRCACGQVHYNRIGESRMTDREVARLQTELDAVAQPVFLMIMAWLSNVPIAVLTSARPPQGSPPGPLREPPVDDREAFVR